MGVTGDDKLPYNDATIAVIAWSSMMIAGAAFLVLGVGWVVIAALKERQRIESVSVESLRDKFEKGVRSGSGLLGGADPSREEQ